MAGLPAPTVSNIQQQLRAFLLAVLPSDVEVVQGQSNQVPEVESARFIIQSPPVFTRLETNIVGYEDAKFTGSIAGNTLTVTAVSPNTPEAMLGIGSTIFGAGVAAGTQVTAFGSGGGQSGTYTINNSQTVSSETISAGVATVQMNVRAAVQLDFHAADQTAGDLANTVSALMRDGYAVNQFANQSPNFGVVPLYADDARQMMFWNDQQQAEWRWIVECAMQANIIVTVPLQFADSIILGLLNVDVVFPPF
jgi:hypothetical protein